jgi:hypothetical protein
MYRFLVVIEKAKNNYSVYSPDCIATGDAREVAEKNMYEAIEMNIYRINWTSLESLLPHQENEKCRHQRNRSSPAAAILNTGEPEVAVGDRYIIPGHSLINFDSIASKFSER